MARGSSFIPTVILGKRILLTLVVHGKRILLAIIILGKMILLTIEVHGKRRIPYILQEDSLNTCGAWKGAIFVLIIVISCRRLSDNLLVLIPRKL